MPLKVKEHIISKVLVILLSVVLVTPLFVKLNHLFEGHKHEVCETPNANHFHEFEIDCDFYDFKLNTEFKDLNLSFDFFIPYEVSQTINSQYHFISDYQKYLFSLRGPPLSV